MEPSSRNALTFEISDCTPHVGLADCSNNVYVYGQIPFINVFFFFFFTAQTSKKKEAESALIGDFDWKTVRLKSKLSGIELLDAHLKSIDVSDGKILLPKVFE